MQFEKIEQIGNVLLKQGKCERATDPIFSDAIVELRFNKKFRNDSTGGAREEFTEVESRVLEYHASPISHNLLKWFSFESNGAGLEIGARYGALTGLLCDKLKKVTCLEFDYPRARLTAHRHQKRDNLEVIAGSFQDFEPEQRFDYITAIGVLEYAGNFYSTEQPFQSFLTRLRKLLKPDGTLILAVENKIGLKYIAGAAQNHDVGVFEAIYDYPFSHEARRFCKKELTELLQSAGFAGLDWYYPFPDYKRPETIFSEKFVPKDLDRIWSRCPAKPVALDRAEILSGKQLGQAFVQAGLFGEFANAFLIVARGNDMPAHSRCLGFIGANQTRKREFRTNISIIEEDQNKILIKSADSEKAVEFLKRIAQREDLAVTGFGEHAKVITGSLKNGCIQYPYLNYPTLEDLIAGAIKNADGDFGAAIVERYVKFIHKLPAKVCRPEEFMRQFGIHSEKPAKPMRCLHFAPIDCVPCNILVNGRGWYVVDHEWTYECPMPSDFLIYRGICTLVMRLQDHIQAHVSKQRPAVIFCGYGKNRTYIPYSWLDLLRSIETPFEQLLYWDWLFQRNVLNEDKLGSLRLKKRPKKLHSVTPVSKKLMSIIAWRLNRLRYKHGRHAAMIKKKIDSLLTQWRK